ncbi:hypothetical protein [Mucilaginibacter dorajii]|uniref:Uncharacterized protein n=1 Tax=Mucilaginibacter dorajii TaxID=692994 RepID=A0ABP7PKK5_9SPHI|nr:hypothetical protein [Mucilaginibacter dorajii]MCS3733590.1 hypothetical protein [Mucilaginibacter dorajii]
MENAHQVSTDEIDKVRSIGFKIEHTESKYPAEFINEHFAGLEIFAFLNEITDLLKPTAEGSLMQTVDMSDTPPPMLLVGLYATDHNDDDRDLIFERSFIRYPDQLIVEHDYFNLPLSARMQRLSIKVTACCLKQYINLGVNKIKVHATLKDGGFIWAKFGFKAIEKAEVTTILNSAKKDLSDHQFNVVERFYKAYYDNEPNGTNFPMEDWGRLAYMENTLKGSDWHGELDLMNQKDFTNFKNYVTR